MQQYTICEAVQDDLPAIVAIYNSTVPLRTATADLQPVKVDERQAWFDAHGGSRPLYVVKNGQSGVLAWGSFSDYYPRAAYRISAEISIYVHESQRGAGLGRMLAEYMCAQAPALGIRNVVAVVFGHNAASIRLFESLGFAQWGRLPQVCDMQAFEADIVILGRRL